MAARATSAETGAEADEQSRDHHDPERAHRPKKRGAFPERKAQSSAADQAHQKDRAPCLAGQAVALRRQVGRGRHEEATEYARDSRHLSAQHGGEEAGETDQDASDEGVQECVMIHQPESRLAVRPSVCQVCSMRDQLPEPRNATVKRKVATLSLPDAITFVRSIYRNEIDKMMNRFKKSAPDFYQAYFAGRVIIDRTARTPARATRRRRHNRRRNNREWFRAARPLSPFSLLRSCSLRRAVQLTTAQHTLVARSHYFFLAVFCGSRFNRKKQRGTPRAQQTMRTKQLQHFIITICALSSFVATCGAATVPYFEDFESYPVGDTTVTNFTEESTLAWTIVAGSFSGQAYQNEISVFSSGVGESAGENSSAVVEFPSLAAASFFITTSFVIDTLTLDGTDPNNTASISLVARAADSMPASSGGDRYQVSYFLDDDGLGHPTGKLYLTEHNLFFGDSLNELSTTALPVVLGHIYSFSFAGKVSGASLRLTARLLDTVTSTAIIVSDTDSSNLLGVSFFGYFNNVRVEDGGTVTLNADFDNFSARRRRPHAAALPQTN